MKINLKMNGLNRLKKGDEISCLGIIVQGRVQIQRGGMLRIAQKGDLIGIFDSLISEYPASAVVLEDTFLYAFSVSPVSLGTGQTDKAASLYSAEEGTLGAFFKSNPDYRGIAVYSAALELADFFKKRKEFFQTASDIRDQLNADADDSLESLSNLNCSEDKLSNYLEYAQVSLENHKKYYYNSVTMTMYQIREISFLLQEIMDSCRNIQKYLNDSYFRLAGEVLMEEEAVWDFSSVRNKFGLLVQKQEEEKKKQKEEIAIPIEKLMEVLKNSLAQILRFAQTGPEEQKEITETFLSFVNAKDRLSTQDDMRKIKKQLTTYYFKLYQICIFKWLDNETLPLAVKMFLNFGYMDERLLKEEQIQFLYKKMYESFEDLVPKIYTIPEWLKEIYEGRKEPSRNSFEQDYRDFLREEKRTGKITEKQEKELLEDNRKKVIFEIENMFVSNNKIINGKLSTYVPVLYDDEIYGHLERMFLSKKQLSDEILELEKKDFTIFQREVLYTNPDLKIEKEYVIKKVYPDIILVPVYGMASSMWQEITGKRRDTPGRFLFPVITETEVDKLVTKAFGRFHWEYCRCEQGASWNNIQYKSLTSEYMDYIQYYRKNHDLTEEKREKIKAQILKARNNSREIFLIDYELWIYYESKAAMKLNKVARQILATYCPFDKETREVLKSNAAFAEALMIHQKKFGEKKREWEMRIKRRENKNLEIPQEFYDTYRYYADN